MKRFFNIGSILFLVAVLFMPRLIFAGSSLHVSSEAGVSIWLNNELVGKTTGELKGLVVRDLAPGDYNLRAARQGYDPVEKKLTVEDRQTYQWRIDFAKPEMKIEKTVQQLDSVMIKSGPVGTVVLKSIPLNAEIFFNDQSIGKGDREISYAPAGEHLIRFVHNGRKLSGKFSLGTGQTLIVTADFQQGEITSNAAVEEKGRGPEFIILQTARKKKPAKFPHRKHQEMFECAECHHGQDAEGNQTPYTEGMKIQHCVTCHNPKMENPRLNSLMQVGHTKCKGCHKRIVAESGTAGPIGKCSGCHSVTAE